MEIEDEGRLYRRPQGGRLVRVFRKVKIRTVYAKADLRCEDHILHMRRLHQLVSPRGNGCQRALSKVTVFCSVFCISSLCLIGTIHRSRHFHRRTVRCQSLHSDIQSGTRILISQSQSISLDPTRPILHPGESSNTSSCLRLSTQSCQEVFGGRCVGGGCQTW